MSHFENVLLKVIIIKKFSSRTSTILHEENNNILTIAENITKLIILHLFLLFGKYLCLVQSMINSQGKIFNVQSNIASKFYAF